MRRHTLALTVGMVAAVLVPAAVARDTATRTPIKHFIVVIAENHTFDHVFATYEPKAGQTVDNLLTKGIVNRDGSPGLNFATARQYSASNADKYALSPSNRTPYDVLPPPTTLGAHEQPSDSDPVPFATVGAAKKAGNGLADADLVLLTTGATGLANGSVDTRTPNVMALPNGPFQLTHGMSYDAYTGNPVHRFYQMWQQMDCSVSHATSGNPSGCRQDLFPWVATTVGMGSNGAPIPPDFSPATTREGSISMSFYNMASGDAPYLKRLADTYTMSDNFHQAVLGGTGANHIALGNGLALYYSDGAGHVATPPPNEIENPDPQPGTNNYYIQDGYKGGSYSKCADPQQPGVGAIHAYLASLPYKPAPSCVEGAYYLLNNYEPGYNGDGSLSTKPFSIPPSAQRTIGDAMNDAKISWKYYGAGWDAYLKNPSDMRYCTICNPFQYSTSIMTEPAQRAAHLKDMPDFYADLEKGSLPSVAFVKPDDLTDGHPASSKLNVFEAFLRQLVEKVQAHPKIWATTAILVIFDEGGGYWDSGYVQPLDFFGDGPRIPTIMVSPYARGGHVSHVYADTVSVLKFIERNWKLAPVTREGRDNLPNPVAAATPYVPANSPAIGDLTEMLQVR